MKQPHEQESKPQRGMLRRAFLTTAVIASTAGCQNMIRRGQSPEIPSPFTKYSDKKLEGARYVHQLCGISGLTFKQIHGIGLVVDLDGTGSAPRESGQRDHLQRELKLSTPDQDVDDLMSSKHTELVILEGRLPPAARAGDTFDVKVVTMTDSEGTSLAGGRLLESRLRPMARLGRGVKQGHSAGVASGRVTTDHLFDPQEDGLKKIEGVILGGGKATEDRLLGLTIGSKEYNQKTSMQISQAINRRFTRSSSSGRDGVAEPKTDRLIELDVPSNYRHNVGHYASVINQIAFNEPRQVLLERLEELSQQISDPSQAALAALRLEAIGDNAIPALQRALTHQDQEVNFRAAESLAYLGEADGIEVLKQTALELPAFRWHAMTALSSMDDTAATDALTSLLNAPGAETRYGAFCALREQSEDNAVVHGDWLAGDFHLHSVPSDAEPLVHFSRKDRPEIVVFANHQQIAPSFVYVQSGLTVQANNRRTISVKAYSTEFGEESRTCSTEVVDLIRTVADLGFGYRHQFAMLRQAQQSDALEGRLVVDARPKLGRTYIADQGGSEAGLLSATPDPEESDVSKSLGFDKLTSWFKPSE